MGYSKATRYYGLPQFQANDSAKWTSDINEAFATIDTVMHQNEGNSGGGDVYSRIDALELANVTVSTEITKLDEKTQSNANNIQSIATVADSASQTASNALEQTSSLDRRIQQVNNSLSGIENNLIAYNKRIGNVETQSSQNKEDISTNYNRLVGEITSTDNNVATLQTKVNQNTTDISSNSNKISNTDSNLNEMVTNYKKYWDDPNTNVSGLPSFGTSVGNGFTMANNAIENIGTALNGVRNTTIPGIDNRVKVLEKNWSDSNVGSLTTQVNGMQAELAEMVSNYKHYWNQGSTVADSVPNFGSNLGDTLSDFNNTITSLKNDFSYETDNIYEQINLIRNNRPPNVVFTGSFISPLRIVEQPYYNNYVLKINGTVKCLNTIAKNRLLITFSANSNYIYPSTAPIKIAKSGVWSDSEISIIKDDTGNVQILYYGDSVLSVNDWMIINLMLYR